LAEQTFYIKALLISIFHPTLQILTRKFVSSCVSVNPLSSRGTRSPKQVEK
jgi:hypothetical protein